jgi:ABC-type nitrate/sulfonate/bicarbonate transport system permease component
MSDWSASRFRRPSALDGLALVAAALVVLVVFLDAPHVLPRTSEALNLSPSMLPLYAAFSLLRMLTAYALSLGFALGAGYWASASILGRRLILPALDVLQAVPILGFFPAAIFFFIRLFHGSALGVEAAAVFLIFTSQAWNMAFSVYESLTMIPDDLRTASRMSGLEGAVLWRRLLLPACVPRLVYNSMLSWAGGWYFLIASEIIAVAPACDAASTACANAASASATAPSSIRAAPTSQSAFARHGLPGRSSAAANSASASTPPGPRRAMTARSIASPDANDAVPSPGGPSNVERSAIAAIRSASAGRPLSRWIQAAIAASCGRRSKAASSNAASHRASVSP